ncbi:WD40 repeat-like protein [Mycena amicta]|nr:WD40 repeat-like protein [Mycena amicta]
MAQVEPLIRMTADELNCLIYAFLVDSGFTHTAYSLCMEGRLENSPNFSKHIPRGELIDLLSKSLLYREVESHWKADNLALNCKVGFSLLEPHICSLEPQKKSTLTPAIHTQRPLMRAGTDGKRKGSPLGDGPVDKRARRDEDGDGRRPLKPRVKQQGPGDTETDPRAILVLSGHETELFTCAFNPVKPSILLTGSKVVNMWDLPQPPLATSPEFAQTPSEGPHQLEHFGNADQGDVTALHWNNEGSLVAIGSYDTILRICTSTGSLYFSHTQHEEPIFAVRFSRNGKWLLSASLDGTTCVWDVGKRELHTQYRVHKNCCLDVDWISEDIFGSCSADKTIQIMKIGQPEPIKTLTGHQSEVNQIKSNPAGTRLASCSDDQTARIWQIDQLSAVASAPGLDGPAPIILSGHNHSVNIVSWCPDIGVGANEIVATASFDGTARLWDTVTGACLHIFADHKRPVYALRFSPNGRWLATGSGDGWLHVYDVHTREVRWSWFAGFDKPGVFEIDWQTALAAGVDRIALALECRKAAVIDVLKVPALQRK